MVGASKSTSRLGQPAGSPDNLDRLRGDPRGRLANRTWAGRGSGARCDLCRGIIDQDQIEYEIELSAAHSSVITLHLECYEQWMLRRDSRGD